MGHFSGNGKQNLKSGLLLYFRIGLFFIPNQHDLFKSISFLNRTSVWRAFQGTRKVHFPGAILLLGCQGFFFFFANEVATASGETIKKRCDWPHTLLTPFSVHL